MKTSCKTCNSQAETFISFGKQPIANNFLKKDDLHKKEYFFHMQVAFCENCKMVQLVEQPDREMMFHENYAFYSGTSTYMDKHFKEFAKEVDSRFLMSKHNPFVIEIGSNDGIMLKNFQEKGYKHLGFEPSGNVAKVAISKNVNTKQSFFDHSSSLEVKESHGKADLITSANVICHIPNYLEVLECVKGLLNEDGVFAYEDPYIGSIIEKTSYDQIYDEHVFFFSAMSVSNACESAGLQLFDISPQVTHGGSMRYFICHQGKYETTSKVKDLLAKEKDLGLDLLDTYKNFAANVEKSKEELVKLLNELKSQGKKVVGYGATSKSTTVLNFCELGPGHIDYISDTTPIKQGKFTPGTHIPIKPYSSFQEEPPEFTLLFAWNHKQEIMAKEKNFKGSWITYIPSVEVFKEKG